MCQVLERRRFPKKERDKEEAEEEEFRDMASPLPSFTASPGGFADLVSSAPPACKVGAMLQMPPLVCLPAGR